MKKYICDVCGWIYDPEVGDPEGGIAPGTAFEDIPIRNRRNKIIGGTNMTKIREIYRCQICGNVVEVVNKGAVLSCCGEPMKLMKENTSDGAREKHVPVIEPIEGGYRVTVGSVEHPMLPEHYIQWIELLTPTDVLRHELKPGEKPEAIFLTNAEAKDVTAREYCNLHGLWKGVIEG